VQLTARLTHPNTISIYDYGRTPEGVFYYAMELLEGLTLEQLVERHGAQPPARVIHMLLQICGALKEAHNIGLIHRDIKPANLYLCRRGDIPDFIKVLDFGLVRDIKSEHNISRSNITAVVGTPLYLAPEAIVTPERIDARADIYGLGCVAYYLITGTPPFAGENLVELCAHHLRTPPPPPSSRKPVPVDLERAIMACLEKDRETRPQNAQALSEALIRCEDARGWSDRDAETWWAAAPPVSLPAVAAPPSGAQACRTICCADLSQRVARRPKSA
jgi:eukaryotic-like serine/threonine-protein kinase